MRIRSKYETQRWLAREVLDRELPRKPPGKARRSGPARDAKYLAWIRTLPCAACGSERDIEAAHTGRDGGMRQKASDYSCIPLCPDCHTQAAGAYHRIGREEFERRTGIDCETLVKRLNMAWWAGNRCGAA